jgi:hypothetical protein
MSFIHGYLLAGLLLAGVPVLLHLILRQKPKRLRFPAFRFLKARQRTNQRKMQLQHLLLLLLRVLVIIALCLALARPRLFSGQLGAGGDRPVVAVFLFDTSPSMELSVGGVTRLDDAKARAKELLDEMKPDSRAALIDAGEDASEALLPPGEVRGRVESLRTRPGAGALNAAVDRAVRLLDKQDGGEDAPPRLLYIFSDRTRACWDATGLRPRIPEGVTVVFVDVGVEQPRDLGIEKVEVVPPVVAPGARFEVRVAVSGTPGGHESELSCLIDNDPDPDRPPDRRPVKLEKGVTSDTYVFERAAPVPPGGSGGDVAYQLTVRLGARDAMPFNNTRHATFLVKGGRKLLTLVERPDRQKTRVWEAAHQATRSFACEVRGFDEADKLTAKELAAYPVIALFETANVPESWWAKLAAHTRAGGGLAIVPGGEEVLDSVKAFNDRGAAAGLLPAPLVKLASSGGGQPVHWAPFSGAHPLLAPFVAWMRSVDPDFARDELRPFVRRWWTLGSLAKDSLTIAYYADPERSPALVERTVGKGRVVLFTTPLDFRFTNDRPPLPWTNYWSESSFGLVLIDRVCRYLGGEVGVPELNFACGSVVQIALSAPPEPPLSVAGPALAGAERALKAPGADGVVSVAQAVVPGNYQIFDAKNRVLAGFSLDVRAQESDLERVSVEELEGVLGEGSVVQVGRSVSLKDALAGARLPPMELLPYLMMLLLLVLTGESFLANRFYRRAPAPEEQPT